MKEVLSGQYVNPQFGNWGNQQETSQITKGIRRSIQLKINGKIHTQVF